MLRRGRRRRSLAACVVAAVVVMCVVTFGAVKTDIAPVKWQEEFVPSLNWSWRWWESDAMFAPIRGVTSTCPLCNFTATQLDPSSTQEDVVITVAMQEIWGLPTTIRSMRTAGIKSAMIVLADRKAVEKIRESTRVFESCGVNVIDVGELSEYHLNGRYRTRWHLVYDYFRVNPHRFKRFVMTDAYDSFFQGDVFLGSLRPDTIYFSTESISIDACGHNKGWLLEAWPSFPRNLFDNPIVCAGPVAGGVAPLLELCKLMFDLPEWTAKWRSPPDQAYVNYVVWKGLLKTPYEVVPNDGFMTTVGYCNRKNNLTRDANGNVGCPGFKTIPMLLHQYVRPKNMRSHMYRVCQKDGIPYSFKRNPYSQASF